jgi:hypothetical protein
MPAACDQAAPASHDAAGKAMAFTKTTHRSNPRSTRLRRDEVHRALRIDPHIELLPLPAFPDTEAVSKPDSDIKGAN